MNVSISISKDPRRKKINAIGETRWWAKDAVLRKVFVNFGNPKDGLYVELKLTLQFLASSIKFQSNIRIKYTSFIDTYTLMKYETVLTAQLFLQIFDIPTPISNYLQERRIDFIKAHSMVMNAIKSLKEISRKFNDTNNSADVFT